MEKLTELTQDAFLARLASGEPTPGGGSAAALMGALGVALAAMVAGLTSGREKYADEQALIEQVLPRAEQLRGRLAALVEEDSAAYRGVTAVFAMPKGTDAEKAARADAMQRALVACTEAPLATMETALEALRLADRLDGHSNTNAASDLGVAALCLKAAIEGAWLNVLTNLGSLRDADTAAAMRRRGQQAADEALPLADRLYRAALGRVDG